MRVLLRHMQAWILTGLDRCTIKQIANCFLDTSERSLAQPLAAAFRVIDQVKRPLPKAFFAIQHPLLS